MATQLGTEQVSVARVRRTWRLNIESPTGAAPVVTAHREIILCNAADSSLIAREVNAGQVTRDVSKVLGETVKLKDGTMISVAQIAEAIPLFVDGWEAADLAPKS